jgi:hypothetical protein
VSYLEASYEIFMTLKSIFNFNNRSENFFSDYKDYIKLNYINEFIDLGSINLMNRLWKEFKHHKLFEDKFYLIANILHLNVTILNKSNHLKLSKANQVKYINEILNFLYREGYVDLICKNREDPDVANLIEAFTQFSKSNKSFVNDSQKFSGFLRSISKTAEIRSTNPLKKVSQLGPRRFASHNNVAMIASFGNKVNPSLFSKFEKRESNKITKEILVKEKEIEKEISVIKEDPREFQISHNPDYSRKLSDIEHKLSKLEDKLEDKFNYSAPKKISRYNYLEYQKTPTTEFNIISPVKDKGFESCTDYKLNIHELDNYLYVHPKNSSASVSDPFDEVGILSLIEHNLNTHNFDRVKKIIAWRKRILEISKNNGWVVGKILALLTIDKFEISDHEIIEANLKFMDKYNLIEKQIKENFNLDIDFKSLLENYEKGLQDSIKNINGININDLKE